MKRALIFIFALMVWGGLWAQHEPIQPYEELGIKVKVLTLSNGKYQESFPNDTLQHIGSVIFNRVTGEVVSVVERDTLYGEYDLRPEVSSRWISPDPLATKFPGWSPYNYVLNNPIIMIDPDGKAPVWVPRVVGGKIQLIAEAGDNLQTLKKYFAGSSRFTDAQLENAYQNAKGGIILDLPEDNYSKAFSYASNNPAEFPTLEEVSQMSWSESRKSTNYNCYHFAVNGVWEKEIYSFWHSYGKYMMEPKSFQAVLDKHFTPVSADKAIYGETIITMNYSGGYPMHSAVYGGKDRKGNMYVLEKYGGHEAPKLVKLTDDYTDIKFYNEKNAKDK